jgi:hypothetical protein
MANRTKEWIDQTFEYIITKCKCRLIPYVEAKEQALDYDIFLSHESKEEKSKLYSMTSTDVISLTRISGSSKDNLIFYTGLHRSQVKKGYWTQFCAVIHLKQEQLFIIVLTGDMRSNIMQRFFWKMYPSMRVTTLKQVKRFFLFEDAAQIDW